MLLYKYCTNGPRSAQKHPKTPCYSPYPTTTYAKLGRFVIGRSLVQVWSSAPYKTPRFIDSEGRQGSAQWSTLTIRSATHFQIVRSFQISRDPALKRASRDRSPQRLRYRNVNHDRPGARSAAK